MSRYLVIDGVYSAGGKATEAKLTSLRRTLGNGNKVVGSILAAFIHFLFKTGVDPTFDYSVFDRVVRKSKGMGVGVGAAGSNRQLAFDQIGQVGWVHPEACLPSWITVQSLSAALRPSM